MKGNYKEKLDNTISIVENVLKKHINKSNIEEIYKKTIKLKEKRTQNKD